MTSGHRSSARRSRHTPDGYDPGHADLFAHNTIIIDAPAETIWARLTAAAAWPTWYSNASDVVVNDPSGTLSEGVTFDWTTFGLKIASTIAEYVPPARIGWYGTGDQLRAYHTWLLIPRNGTSTYVVMEETGMGAAVRHLAQANPGHMHCGSRPVEHQPQVRVRKLTRTLSGVTIHRNQQAIPRSAATPRRPGRAGRTSDR